MLNGRTARCGDAVKQGDRLELRARVNVTSYVQARFRSAKAPFDLEVACEDDYLAVVVKPAGVPTYSPGGDHGGRANLRSCLPFALKPPASCRAGDELRAALREALGRPIVGDVLYDGGGPEALNFRRSGLFLCARSLELDHPVTGARLQRPAHAPAPAIFTADDARPIVLFDGECNLCNAGVNILLDYDACSRDGRGNLRVAALQSTPGAQYSSIVVAGRDRAWVGSGAVLKIGRQLKAPLKWLAVLGCGAAPRRAAFAHGDAVVVAAEQPVVMASSASEDVLGNGMRGVVEAPGDADGRVVVRFDEPAKFAATLDGASSARSPRGRARPKKKPPSVRGADDADVVTSDARTISIDVTERPSQEQQSMADLDQLEALHLAAAEDIDDALNDYRTKGSRRAAKKRKAAILTVFLEGTANTINPPTTQLDAHAFAPLGPLTNAARAPPAARRWAGGDFVLLNVSRAIDDARLDRFLAAARGQGNALGLERRQAALGSTFRWIADTHLLTIGVKRFVYLDVDTCLEDVWGFDAARHQFNAGVLFVDAEQYCALDAYERIISAAEQHASMIPRAGLVNVFAEVALARHVVRISEHWNCRRQFSHRDLAAPPANASDICPSEGARGRGGAKSPAERAPRSRPCAREARASA
ncbi:pseudouridine synthase [Aureococcus anophagefferens]|uniref:Pseudouridine synthase n=1 Tax=Aureococcus anophagefferens TaxID=44056 RepID=A0ABR1FNX3_AURAN